MKHMPLESDFADRMASPSCLAVMLRNRSFHGVEIKQRLLHSCSAWSQCFQKPLRKALWSQPFRHMRYAPPEVGFQPLADGSWRLYLRGKHPREIISTPLAELRDHASCPSLIVATGPSGKSFDWSTLADKPHLIWAVSGAPTMLAKHGLRCDFLVVSDHRFARDGADHIALAVDQGATLLLTHEAAAGFAATRPEILARARFHVFEKVNRWYGLAALDPVGLIEVNKASGFPFMLSAPPVAGVGWSHDPMVGVFAGKTVTFAALQLAVWAGSQKIEVIGMDLGGTGRSYHEDKPEVSHLEKDYRQFILPAFECMAAALTGSSLRIVNHSPTCPLPKELFTWKRPA